MRATLNIPDNLLSEVQRIAHEKSKTKAVITAMEAFVKDRKLAELRALRGKLNIDYNWEEEERRELIAQEEGQHTVQSNGLMPDTCAWIDYFRSPSTKLGLAVEKALSLEQVYTCGPVISELVQGVKSAREQSILLNALQALPCLEMEQALWVKAGQLSASLRKHGKTLPFSDILIATLALEHNISILTIDKHFKEIPKLNVRGVS